VSGTVFLFWAFLEADSTLYLEFLDHQFRPALFAKNQETVPDTVSSSALVHGRQPRQISFTCTCQQVLASWMLLSSQHNPDVMDDFVSEVLEQLASCEVANRPGRSEPRVLKRRRHGYKLMLQPRAVLKAELLKKCM